MPVVCFTEAPIGEFTRLFELSKIASTSDQRVRYEPYGVAVSKSWLYAQGGRPVIYDATAVLELLPPALRYRFVSYSPDADDDVSWEREWRVHTQELSLDPAHTLVIVPTANEAFEIAYGGATIEPSHDEDGQVDGVLHSPRWLVASLDVFK